MGMMGAVRCRKQTSHFARLLVQPTHIGWCTAVARLIYNSRKSGQLQADRARRSEEFGRAIAASCAAAAGQPSRPLQLLPGQKVLPQQLRA